MKRITTKKYAFLKIEVFVKFVFFDIRKIFWELLGFLINFCIWNRQKQTFQLLHLLWFLTARHILAILELLKLTIQVFQYQIIQAFSTILNGTGWCQRLLVFLNSFQFCFKHRMEQITQYSSNENPKISALFVTLLWSKLHNIYFCSPKTCECAMVVVEFVFLCACA